MYGDAENVGCPINNVKEKLELKRTEHFSPLSIRISSVHGGNKQISPDVRTKSIRNEKRGATRDFAVVREVSGKVKKHREQEGET